MLQHKKMLLGNLMQKFLVPLLIFLYFVPIRSSQLQKFKDMFVVNLCSCELNFSFVISSAWKFCLLVCFLVLFIFAKYDFVVCLYVMQVFFPCTKHFSHLKLLVCQLCPVFFFFFKSDGSIYDTLIYICMCGSSIVVLVSL